MHMYLRFYPMCQVLTLFCQFYSSGHFFLRNQLRYEAIRLFLFYLKNLFGRGLYSLSICPKIQVSLGFENLVTLLVLFLLLNQDYMLILYSKPAHHR